MRAVASVLRLTRRRALLGAACALAAGRSFAGEPVTLRFEQLYESYGVRGLVLSATLRSLNGQDVVMRGYMAPPLKPESGFFVLTREPVALCPFCQSDAEWPDDIVVVYLKAASPLVSAGEAISVHGRLETGSWTDAETGFVSQIRIVGAAFRRA